MSYAVFKSKVIGKHVGDSECVSLVVNNSNSYSAYLFPKVSWTSIFKPVSGAKDLWGAVNTKYFQKIANDAANVSQVPKQGDVMLFSQTPYPGYTNQFNNPFGHTGICEKADSTGYWLLQQNAPNAGQVVNVTFYPWKFRHCIGWLRPISQPAPKPTPKPKAPAQSAPVAKIPTPVTTPALPIVPKPAVIQTPEPTVVSDKPLPQLVNNVPSPVPPVPQPIVAPKQNSQPTNTPIKQDKASTLSKLNPTSNNWWQTLLALIKKIFN